jgi:hypothetical protein
MYRKNKLKIVKFTLEKHISTKKFPFSVKKITEFDRKKPLTIPLIIKKLAQFLVTIV